MSLTVTPGYSWVDGEVVTATKLNLAAAPTVTGSGTYSFASGSATAASINFSADTTSGFYLYDSGQVGFTTTGAARAVLSNYFTFLNGDNTTGVNNIPQHAFGYNGAFQFQHFIQTRHNSAAGTSGNAFAFWINTSATATASTQPGTGNAIALDLSADNVKLYSANGTLGATLNSASTWIMAGSAQFSTSGKGIIGTTTADSANTGIVGEVLAASVSSTAAISLTTSTTANVTSISLTAGDWDVRGAVWFTPNAGTSVNQIIGGISQTSATLPTKGDGLSTYNTATPGGIGVYDDSSVPVGPWRISVASTTTIYLVARSVFFSNTQSAYGSIQARRVR